MAQNAIIPQAYVVEDSAISFYAAIWQADATYYLQSDFTAGTITFNVYDLDATDPTASIDSGTLDETNVIFDTLQTDAAWEIDTVGYNFRYTWDAKTVGITGGNKHVIVFLFSPSTTADFRHMAYFVPQSHPQS